MKRILYIGNNLSQKSNYKTSIAILSDFLSQEYTITVSSNKTNKILRLLDMCFQLIKKRPKIDIVLIDTFSSSAFYYAYITSQLARLLKIPYIPILHGGNLPSRLDHSTKLCNALFKNAFKNVAPSGYLQYEFYKRGYDTVLIPNVLDLSLYTYRKRENIRPRLLYVRAFAEIYNPKMAIYVLQELKKTYPTAELCMIGPDRDGSLADVQNLVETLGLQDSVEFTGVLDKSVWHKKSEEYDLFINTTNFDNTPISVMEIMALGLPIVSTNVGGLPYLLEDKKDAFLVEKNDIYAMTQAIIKYLDDKQKVADMSLKARQKVEKFDWKFVKKDWNHLLN